MYDLSSSVVIAPWENVTVPFRSPSFLLVAVTGNCRIYPTEGRQLDIGRAYGVSMQEGIPATDHVSHKILFVVNLFKLMLLQRVSIYTVSCVLRCLCFINFPIASETSAV